ncbi:MAG: UDP-3-O-(3-hydroxymyristoyl)glucosamine N-acyltransferase [Planctomycetota bacterium]
MLGEIAEQVGARLEGDATLVVSSVAPLLLAEAGQLSFIADELKKAPEPEAIRASALIVAEKFAAPGFTPRVALLRAKNPKLAFARALELFHPEPLAPFQGISPAATIHSSVRVGVDARIGANVFIAADTVIGDRVTLYPGVCVGRGTQIADDVVIYPNATLYARTVVGSRCIIHAGAVLGSDGFGYAESPTGAHKIRHCGRVVIEDDVEIGANSTIDRGMLDDTVIGCGTKIDNLVQVGHNSRVGAHSFLCAQVGLAGSSTIGSRVMLGGQVGLAGHLVVGDGARIGAQAGVHHSVPAGSTMLGSPALDSRHAARVFASMSRLPELRVRLAELEREIEALRERLDEKHGKS